MLVRYQSYLRILLIVFLGLTYSKNILAQAHAEDEEVILHRQLSLAKDTTRAQILFSLGILYADKFVHNKSDADTALNYYQEALTMSKALNYGKGKAMASLLEAKIYRLKSDDNHLKLSLAKAVKATQKAGFPELVADAVTEQGVYYLTELNDLKKSDSLFSSAVAIYQKIAPNSVKLAYALQYYSVNQTLLKKYEKGLLLLNKALVIYQVHKVRQLEISYYFLALCHVGRGDFENAIKNALVSVRLAEHDRNSETLCDNYAILAEIYQEKKMPTVRISYLEKALSNARYLPEGDILFYIATLGDAYVKNQQFKKAITVLNRGLKEGSPKDPIYTRLYTALTDVYVATGQYLAAERNYGLMMAAIRQKGYAFVATTIQAHFTAVRLFLATKQFEKAREHIQALQDTTYIKKFRPDMITLEQLSFQVDSAQGNYLSAIHHFQRFKTVSDSVEKLSNSKQVAALQIQYETEKKDQNILSLTQQTRLQEKTMKTQKEARNLLYGSIVLLVFLLGLGFNRYQLKQRATRELSEQQTQIQSQNKSLKELLTEREWLLKEIHHRVKNNLQIVISLLNSQSSYLNDEAALDVIRESQHRMQSISLIHQKLYQDDNLSGINMRSYIHDLLNYLQDCFSTSGYIAFLPDVDDFNLDVSQAVPLGLILNEAITNAIKYAFKGRKNGVIKIKLDQKDERLHLKIADNGMGIPNDFDIDGLNSMGMNLMKGLSRQLGASFGLKNEDGLCIELIWKQSKMLTQFQEPQPTEALI